VAAGGPTAGRDVPAGKGLQPPPSAKESSSLVVCRVRHSVHVAEACADTGVGGGLAAGGTTMEYPMQTPVSPGAALAAQLVQHPTPGCERHHAEHAALVTPGGAPALSGCCTWVPLHWPEVEIMLDQPEALPPPPPPGHRGGSSAADKNITPHSRARRAPRMNAGRSSPYTYIKARAAAVGGAPTPPSS
jgi:hypothetical protein